MNSRYDRDRLGKLMLGFLDRYPHLSLAIVKPSLFQSFSALTFSLMCEGDFVSVVVCV